MSVPFATCASVPAAHAEPGTPSVPTFNVISYGANPGGKRDNTAAFAAAIAAAEAAGGGEVYVPSGTYAFTKRLPGTVTVSVRLAGPAPVTLAGAGRDTTSLVEHVPGQNLVAIRGDHSAVEGLTLDARTHAAGHAVTVNANYTTLAHVRALGADKSAVIGSGSVSPFVLYYQGPAGATPSHPLYEVGNTVLDAVITDGVNNDGFSFSFQKDATITDVTHFGSRLALYVDSYVTVTNYTYRPNPICMGATNGFWVTPPSDHITINGFTSYGSGGVIGGPVNPAVSKSISISDERLATRFGYHLEVGNVEGLTISRSHLNVGNELDINPPDHAIGVTISNSGLRQIVLSGHQGRPYSWIAVAFVADTFRPVVTSTGTPSPTFLEASSAGPGSIQVKGGEWLNHAGGFRSAGGATTFTVKALGNYP